MKQLALFFLTTWRWWIWFVLLSVFSAIYKSPKIRAKFKGQFGEKVVRKVLNNLPEEYIVLNDILLSKEAGTSQIDHIVLSPYGIFVIETKNYKGIITGSDNMANWCQNIYGHKKTFMNPVNQNIGHVKTLRKHLIEFGDLPIVPIVVFISDCNLKINTKYPVIYAKQLLQCVLKLSNKPVLGTARVNSIKEKLLADNITDKKARKKHNEEVKTKKGVSQQSKANGKCPCCGGVLIAKQGQFGAFLGCENYPKCKYTDNI